jgi:thiol-disulfide isomerase/thioredoxin
MLIAHLIDKPVQSARWNIPVITAPNYSNVTEYVTDGRWLIEPAPPRLKAKLAFLTDGRAISYAESYMGIIEAYKLAEIVGEPTAGTNGNINWVVLPGEYRVIFTGMKVLKHDGSRHHGIGIQPTVAVSRTIIGVREKRDEQLERAIDLVSESPDQAPNTVVPKPTPKPLSDEVMNMELTALDGTTFKLADYKGKVIIVNLWASWCFPCRYETPELLKLSKDFENRDIVVIGLTSEDPVKDRKLVKDFVRYYKIRYKIGWGDASFSLGMMQGQVRNSIPQSFVISRDGRVTKRFIGFNSVETPQKLHKAVEDTLNDSNE